MMENQEKEKYRVEMIERKVLSLNGVESVENFDESKVTLKNPDLSSTGLMGKHVHKYYLISLHFTQISYDAKYAL